MGDKIEYGWRVFKYEDIKGGNCYLARSLLSDSLEIDTLTFNVKSEDTSLTQFTRNAPLVYSHNDRRIGTFYVQKVERLSKYEYRFIATSAVGLLDQMNHYGGMYTGQTVKEVVESICGSVPVMVKTNIQNTGLYGWLPIATCRENLSQVLFAIGATLKIDHNGVLRVEGLWNEQSSSIGVDSVFEGGSVEHRNSATHVVVMEHQYTKGGEKSILFEGVAKQGDTITFDEPAYDLVAEGFTILSSGANFAVVSGGNGALSGNKYTHNTRAVEKQIWGVEWAAKNVINVKNATLVSLVNSKTIAERLAAYYALSARVQTDVVYGSEIPGDVVQTIHPYGDTVQSCLESVDLNMSGKLRGMEKSLIGYLPPDIGGIEYYDRSECLEIDGEWVVPDGVTSVRVVLIGGGQGGFCGADGEAAATNGVFASQSSAVTDTTTSLSICGFAVGGKGGKAGNGGSGGKVLQLDLAVVPGQTLPVKIGSGGKGGLHSSGEVGTATVFGEHSSESGAASSAGFADPFSGDVYAASGAPGVDGGNGSGAKENATSEEWQTVVPGSTVVEPDGIPHTPGSNSSAANFARTDVGSPTGPDGTVWGVLYTQAFGGCGGGAAVGANGLPGGEETITTAFRSGTTLCGTAKGAKGGDGANATAPPKQSKRGCGGVGGHGGGGGGSGGAGLTKKITPKNTYTSPSYNATQRTGDPGLGGLGSNGGDGGDGCIILYYKVPKLTRSGKFVTRDGQHITDKHGRKVVV